jgi:hypothetical protein
MRSHSAKQGLRAPDDVLGPAVQARVEQRHVDGGNEPDDDERGGDLGRKTMSIGWEVSAYRPGVTAIPITHRSLPLNS